MIKGVLSRFFGGWVNQTGVQTATFVVMLATYTIIICFLNAFVNLDKIFVYWGESIELSIFLDKQAESYLVDEVETFLKENKSIDFYKKITGREALEGFKKQVSSYAPDLFEDPLLVEILPDRLQASMASNIKVEKKIDVLKNIAEQLKKFAAVEDVSYGQNWVGNYSNLVRALTGASWTIVFVLLLAGFFIVGNSVRVSVSQRRQEIEVLELVGATHWSIRLPFIGEGLLMGLFSSIFALGLGYGFHIWITDLIALKLSFLDLATVIEFLNLKLLILIPLVGALVGAIGAYFCVSNLNDGWAAARGVRA